MEVIIIPVNDNINVFIQICCFIDFIYMIDKIVIC